MGTSSIIPTRSARGRLAVFVLAATVVASAALARRATGSGDAENEAVPSTAAAGLVQPGEISAFVASQPVAIAAVLVAIGDAVTRGQPIARVDQSEADRQAATRALDLERARQDVEARRRSVAWLRASLDRLAASDAATAQLALAERDAQQAPTRQTRDSPARAKLAYEQAQLRSKRLEELAASGLVPKQEVDDSHFAVQIAAEDLANARQVAEAADRLLRAQSAQARTQRASSMADQQRQLADEQSALQQALIHLRQVQLSADAASRAAADAFLRAPRSGNIFELPVHTGDRLTEGMLIARLASIDPLTIDVDVAPALVNGLRPGESARADLPASGLYDRPVRIRSIAPAPGDDGRYHVALALPNPAHRRLAGQVAYVTFGAGGQS